MKQLLLILLFSIVSFSFLFSQDISIGEKSVKYLASDKLEGRFPGTMGDMQSMLYLQTFMEKHNLKPFNDSYKQLFEIVTDIKPASDCKFALQGKELKLGVDYMPLSFSANKILDAFVFPTSDLMNKELKVDGSAWLLYYHQGEEGEVLKYRDLMNFSIEAKKRGAEGLILVSEKNLSKDSEFYPFNYSRSFSQSSIPVVQISKASLLAIMQKEGYKGSEIDKSAISFLQDKILQVNAHIKIDKTYSQTANINGYIEGANSDEWIVIGAHYDHLGWGGYDSGSRDPERKEVHNGADDNASGVAMVLMLADYYSKNPPPINIAFVLFGAEEQGLIGSKYFVDNSPIELEKIKVMLNFDMVGRLKDSTLSIIGTTTAAEFDRMLNKYQNQPLALKLGGGGYSGSDQASFYAEKIPVLFISTGMHSDYHMPEDDIEFINFEGMQIVSKVSVRIINDLCNVKTKLTYQEVEQKQNGRHGGSMQVKLGIFPDMTSDEGKGLGVSGVSPGGVADKAGVIKGDVIIKMDGNDIAGIYEYMNLLAEFKKGQKIKIVVRRGKKKVKLKVKF